MIAWLIETLLAVTLMMALVLALRGPVARSFGAGWAYSLWLIPALRLVVPPLPLLAGDLALPPVASFIPATAVDMAAPLPAEAGPRQWVPLMLALWAGGAVIFLILQWLSYRAFVRRLEETARPGRPPLFGGIRTWISDAADGPMAIGALKRRIVLPADFSRRYSPVERRLALEHELIHHRRGDIWWNLAAMIVLALFWFNPVAWVAFRAFRADQELACDSAVARASSTDERCDYARALVKSATKPGLIAACALNRADELKRRLRMMRGHRSSGLRSAGGLVAFGLVALVALAVGSGEARLAPLAPPQFASLELPTTIAAAAEPLEPAHAAVAPAVAHARPHVRPRSPRETLKAARPSVASAEAPQVGEAALAALARALPPLRGLEPRPAAASYAFSVAKPGKAAGVAVTVAERHVIRVSGAPGEPAKIYVLSRELSAEDAAEVRQAVAEAVERARARRPAPAPRPAPHAAGGLDSPIQTIVEGDTH